MLEFLGQTNHLVGLIVEGQIDGETLGTDRVFSLDLIGHCETLGFELHHRTGHADPIVQKKGLFILAARFSQNHAAAAQIHFREAEYYFYPGR